MEEYKAMKGKRRTSRDKILIILEFLETDINVHKKKQTSLDDTIAKLVKKFSTERPAYGTRRLAAMISQENQRPVNRKQIQRICRKMKSIVPVTIKKEAVKRGSRKVKASSDHMRWILLAH